MSPRWRSTLAGRLTVSHLLVAMVAVVVVAVAEWTLTSLAADRFVEQVNQIEERTGFVPPGLAARRAPATDAFRGEIATATLVGAAVAGLVGVALASFVAVRLSRPMRRASVAARRLAAGERELAMASAGIAEVDELSDALRQLAADLDATEQERDRIIDDVTHELRTPMAVLRGHLEGLRDGVIPAAPETTRRLLAEIDRMGRLVEDLRATRELAAADLDLRPVALAEAVESAVARHRLAADGLGIGLDVETDASPEVLGDASRLAQVLDNLLANALAHAPSGTSVALRIGITRDRGRVEVIDRGPGLEPAQQALVFERLYRTDRARDRDRGGAGIGLAVARRIVEAHGGRIGVDSGAGDGATFWFELPLRGATPLTDS